MSKLVKMSQGKFIIYSMGIILIGAAVAGIPLFNQSKNYYDQKNSIESELTDKQEMLDLTEKNAR